MRRITLLVGVLGAALGVIAAPAGAANAPVDVGDEYFSPARVAVRPGESVMWTNPGTIEPHNVVFFDGFAEPPKPQSDPWKATRTFTAPGKYAYYCDQHGQAMSGVVYVNDAGALPPLVSLVVSPNPAVTGQTVSFDASGSSDPRGIAKYEWDLDGTGWFASDPSTTPRVSRSYTSLASLTVKVRVTNTLGLSDERSVSLVVNAPSAPPPTPPAPPPAGTTRPVVTEFAVTNRIFRAGKASTRTTGNAAKKAATGTTFKYKLSETATVKIDLQQLLPGRKMGRGAVSRGTLTRTSHVGANSVAFTGRIGNKVLAPGNYQAVLTATNATGVASAPKTITLKVVRA
jgi:plastocyanin